MKIFNIAEPDSHKNKSIAIGIDFGTTNSLVAFSENRSPRIIPDDNSRGLIPSTISFENNQVLIGKDRFENDQIIHSIKRILGKSKEELLNSTTTNFIQKYLDKNSSRPLINIGDNKFTSSELVAQILSSLKNQAERALNKEISDVVLTVPAYFDDTAKGEIMFAAKIAQLNVLRLISEPTAAAYAYGIEKKAHATYLVFDLGGGTFDVSLIKLNHGILKVIAANGDNNLGGNDIDYLIAKHLSEKHNIHDINSIIYIAKTIKHELTYQDSVSIKHNNTLFSLDRTTLSQLIEPIMRSMINIVKNTLSTLENEQKLDGIILVGGSTRMLLIKERLQQEFMTQILSDIDPDKIVAFGAALQAENLTKSSDQSKDIIIDALPLSLGIELYGSMVEKIILRNTSIPISVKKEFTTYVDNQNAIMFHIVQGEREMAQDCRSIAKFELSNLPKAKAGQIKVEVIFSIDSDGILSVSAFEKISGNSHTIEVKPTYGLSKDEIDQILEKAYRYSRADHESRLLSEVKFNANKLIKSTQENQHTIKEVMSSAERQKLKNMLHKLNLAIQEDDYDKIIYNTESLSSWYEKFSEIMLNLAISDKLEGKNIDKIQNQINSIRK
ncbi:MAG: Hsp70 family protein [Rickettsiaceae bacterium]